MDSPRNGTLLVVVGTKTDVDGKDIVADAVVADQTGSVVADHAERTGFVADAVAAAGAERTGSVVAVDRGDVVDRGDLFRSSLHGEREQCDVQKKSVIEEM